MLKTSIFSSPEHEVLRLSYCDHSPSRRRPSIVCSHFFVYTLASTNMNQLALNLVQMYMTIRSRMSLFMEVIGPQLSELSALELENLPYLTLFTLQHLQILTNQYQILAIIYIPIKCWMSWIVSQIKSEYPE